MVSQTNGAWGKAIQVPGTGTLNAVNAASARCRVPQRATAQPAGSYPDSSGNSQGFVVSETNGTWGEAFKVPGLATLNKGLAAAVDPVSCAPAGNCAAAGYYSDRSFVPPHQRFVVSQPQALLVARLDTAGRLMRPSEHAVLSLPAP